MSWIKNSLTYKYMVAVIIAAGIIGVISSFLMFIYQRNQSIQEMQDNLSSMSNAIKFSLEYEMASNQQEEISQIIETIGNGGDFRNIMIINKKGVIKSSSNVDDIGITIDIDEPTCQGCHKQINKTINSTQIININKEKIFRNVNPILNRAECYECHNRLQDVLGMIVIDISMEKMQNELVRNFKMRMLYHIAMIISVVLTIYFLMHNMVTRRLKRFLKVTCLISTGDLSQRVGFHSKDELGELSTAFDEMAQELNVSRNTLEDRVRERTQRLEESNAKLQLTQECLSQKLKELSILYEISRDFSRSLTRESTLNAVLEKIQELTTETEICLLLLVSNGILELKSYYGIDESIASAYKLNPITVQDDFMVAKSNEDGFASENRFLYIPEINAKFQTDSSKYFYSFPLTANGKKILGVLCIETAGVLDGKIKELYGHFFTCLVNDMTFVLENNWLYNELESGYFETVRSLTKAIEAKDPYTHGHCDRVMIYSLRIAEKLKLSDEEKKLLTYSALLHDIGKIGIQGRVLNKDSQLDDIEYAHIQIHPRLGAEIIKPVKFLEQAYETILYHHERYDGFGYPDKLKGKEIPLHSRIITVADAFDAMISDRPYRKAYEIKEAVDEVIRYSGTQFDPLIVEIFMELNNEGGFILDEELLGNKKMSGLFVYELPRI